MTFPPQNSKLRREKAFQIRLPKGESGLLVVPFRTFPSRRYSPPTILSLECMQLSLELPRRVTLFLAWAPVQMRKCSENKPGLPSEADKLKVSFSAYSTPTRTRKSRSRCGALRRSGVSVKSFQGRRKTASILTSS